MECSAGLLGEQCEQAAVPQERRIVWRPLEREVDLRAEYADMRAGRRYCAAYSEHRVNTMNRNTVNTAEYG